MKSVKSSTCSFVRPKPFGDPGPRGCVNRGDSVAAAPAVGSCGTPALKYSTASRTLVSEPLWKKLCASLA